MNKKGGLIISAAIIIIALMIGFSGGWKFFNNSSKVQELESQLTDKDSQILELQEEVQNLNNQLDSILVCPNSESIDCMPPVIEENRQYCSGQYLLWIQQNCDTTITF